MFYYYYYLICYFILGICMGSFYYVVGDRLSVDKSIVYPSSHCPNCKHKLKARDLIPIFSYLFSGGKCRYCKKKISMVYPSIELLTGVLFVISYLVFPELGLEQLIAIVLASLIVIVSVSDFKYLVIPDQVLIAAGIILVGLRLYYTGIMETLAYMGYGLLAFLLMLLIKLAGDFAFKKESMGGADIKYMFISGLAIGIIPSIFVIFFASVTALPVALFILIKKKEHILPYGPFLVFTTWALWLGYDIFYEYLNLLFTI